MEKSEASVRNALTTMAELIGHCVEGIARTGAFDQAANGELVISRLEGLNTHLQDAGIASPVPALRSAKERIENKIHIKRLCG